MTCVSLLDFLKRLFFLNELCYSLTRCTESQLQAAWVHGQILGAAASYVDDKRGAD